MNRLREILGVALAGLGARKVRTALIALGPMLGVASIIAAVGMSQSAKGDLRAKLQKLGTNLIVVEASDTFGGASGSQAKLPKEAVQRAYRVPMVEKVAPVVELSNIQVSPTQESQDYFSTLPVAVRVADTNLPAVLGAKLRVGRWLDDADATTGTRAAVIGSDLAKNFTYLNDEIRTIRLNGIDYAVVGVLDPVDLVPAANSSVYIPHVAAKRDFDADPEPTTMYVRVRNGTTDRAKSMLPVAIALGGDETVTTTVPSSLLQAEAQVDKTLQAVVIAMGALALVVGGVGIANVMSISVIQRSSEIGIRRDRPHPVDHREPVPDRGVPRGDRRGRGGCADRIHRCLRRVPRRALDLHARALPPRLGRRSGGFRGDDRRYLPGDEGGASRTSRDAAAGVRPAPITARRTGP